MQEQQPKKLWDEKLYKDWMAEKIAEGKTPEERKQIEESLCVALMMQDFSGLQGF